MRIVHFRDAYQEDIPRIVKPDKAAGYIRKYLSRQPGFYETIFGIDSFLYDAGVHYAPAPYQIESIMERLSWWLESGDYLLLGDREDGFDTILFFGDISPFVSTTFRERVKRLPPRPQYGYGNYSKAPEPIIEPDMTPAPEAPAELKETGITKAINAMMGGAKQVINDYIDEQRASQAEWLADKGIIQAKDEATGQILTPEELGDRYRGNPVFPLADEEQIGADSIKSLRGYEAGLLLAEAMVNRKKIVTDAKEIKDKVVDSIKDTKNKPIVGSNNAKNNTLVEYVDNPNPLTGEGYGVNNPPVRIDGEWSNQDYFNALNGRSPKGLGKPDLHHADQMPGSGIHEIIPTEHRGNKALHGQPNQGVTPEMRKAEKELHWWYRAREQGADELFPDWIYD
ncbi:hypothetical protein [Shewanella algae]|uniref:hypothetical protein n=1 Tax=Shewanella algae TaxID=38313 RepID=UPI001AAF4A13|nr:hypothetical protein [Shewanella algae]MBO2588854.1 hypothetical protein [Shewanella algae]